MSGQHADFAPSGMYLTVACPGWIKQSKSLPPQLPTEATIEGEAGHAVAAAMALATVKGPCEPGILAEMAEAEGVTEEMIDGGHMWVEALEGYPAHIETPIQIQRVHMTKCWGTPDARQYAFETKRLRLADYKYGHEFVDEFENWQMLAYAVGAIDEHRIYDDPDVVIDMTVVQPRHYGAAPVRTWSIKLPEIWPYLERMQAAVREAEGPNPRTISGTHCTHCPARVNCPTFGKAVMHAVDFTGRADPMVSTAEQIGRELVLVQEFIKRLKARETGLSTMAEGMIRNGQRVPYFSLAQTYGHLAWTMPMDVVEMSAQMVGKSALKPPALITPTQAKDRKILDTRVIAAYSDRPLGSFKLTRDSVSNTTRKFKS
jgi:hypothetical protein